MSMTKAAPHAEMHVSTPGNWVALDLDQLGDETLVARLVDDGLAEMPALATHRDELIGLLVRSTDAARQAGVAFAAVMIDTSGSATPVVASLTVAIIDWSGESPAPEDDQETVTLPAGEALRCERVQPTAITADGTEVMVLTTQYVLPMAGRQRLALMTFTSPNVPERDDLSVLFRRIAETLEPATHTHDHDRLGG